MEFRLNYRAVKSTLGLSYKQISTLLANLTLNSVLNYTIVEDNGYHVDVTIKDLTALINLISKKGKGLSQDDLKELLPSQSAKLEKIQESEFIKDVQALKTKYPANSDNRYFKHFTNGHKRQFFSTIAARLEKGKFSLIDLERAFEPFPMLKNYSLVDMLNKLPYGLHEKILDFLWIQTEGKVANVAMEGKAAKELVQWIEKGTTTFEEMEDCWIQILVPSKYNLSLVSLKKALQGFSKLAVQGLDGRFITGIQKWLEKNNDSVYNTLKSSVDSVKL